MFFIDPICRIKMALQKKTSTERQLITYILFMSNTRRPWKLLHETSVVLHSSGSQSQQILLFFHQIGEISLVLGNMKTGSSQSKIPADTHLSHCTLLEQMEKAEKVLLCNIKCD